MIELSRRRLLGSLVGLIAAPAIVRATSLMSVRAWSVELPLIRNYDIIYDNGFIREAIGRFANSNRLMQEMRLQHAEDFALFDGLE